MVIELPAIFLQCQLLRLQKHVPWMVGMTGLKAAPFCLLLYSPPPCSAIYQPAQSTCLVVTTANFSLNGVAA